MKTVKENVEFCLNCKIKPCSLKGCPLGNDIPGFIQEVKNDNILGAYEILSNTTVLPSICGKICPHMKQCQGVCIRAIKNEPVEIGKIEEFISQNITDDKILSEIFKGQVESIFENKRVAVIGGGPAGLTCAAFLAKKGVKVTIYEKHDYLGGLLMHGIPDFRLERESIKKTVNRILSLGIDVKYNQELGKNLNINDLEKEYNKIFLSVGANISSKMRTPGEEKEGVFGGNQLLEYNLHPDYTNKSVCVIGGGNVAMDCARTIKRLGAKSVKVIYRRAREQMPAEAIEVEEAIHEGIEFLFKNNITKIIGDTKVEKVELIKTELIQKEGDSRLSPVDIEGSNYEVDMDYVIRAVGSSADEVINTLGLEQNKWGNIVINENYQTSNPNIYCGGDLIGKNATVAWASYYGREAANNILEVLR